LVLAGDDKMESETKQLRYVILYGVIIETDDDGAYFDYTYFGGIKNEEQEARSLAREIVNDDEITGTKVPMIYKLIGNNGELKELLQGANKQFLRMANDIYEAEDSYRK